MNTKINMYFHKLKSGNSNYFDNFYDETKGAIFYTINKILNNKEEASDIMQETYLSFLKIIKEIDENKNPYSYLITMARNKALNRLKILGREELIDEESNIFMNRDSEMPMLELLKKKISKEDFQIIELCIIYGYKRVEVAKMLNKPVSTINYQYNNILKNSKKLVKEVYNG